MHTFTAPPPYTPTPLPCPSPTTTRLALPTPPSHFGPSLCTATFASYYYRRESLLATRLTLNCSASFSQMQSPPSSHFFPLFRFSPLLISFCILLNILIHTHTHTYTRARARTHTHTHTHKQNSLTFFKDTPWRCVSPFAWVGGSRKRPLGNLFLTSSFVLLALASATSARERERGFAGRGEGRGQPKK